MVADDSIANDYKTNASNPGKKSERHTCEQDKMNDMKMNCLTLILYNHFGRESDKSL